MAEGMTGGMIEETTEGKDMIEGAEMTGETERIGTEETGIEMTETEGIGKTKEKTKISLKTGRKRQMERMGIKKRMHLAM